MNKLIMVAALMMLAVGTASARDQGIINQADPYEATMKFYLHPAHGFPGKAEASEQTASGPDAGAKSDSSGEARVASKARNTANGQTASKQRS